jgi:phytoene dehydrogenase-like protein
VKQRSPQTTQKPIAIIGAGAAGLAIASELARRSHQVQLFESHSLPGGCASWFRRSTPIGSLQFDVGATVLDGLEDGAFLNKQMRKWNVKAKNFERMPFINFQDQSKYVLQTTNIEAWISSLIKKFPEDQNFLNTSFRRLCELAKGLKPLIEAGVHFPPQTFHDLVKDTKLFPHLLPLLKSFWGIRTLSFSDFLSHNNISPALYSWIEMNLLITVQSNPQNIYTPWASLALCFYPLGAGTCQGGMRGLIEPWLRNLIESNNVQVKLKHKVTRIFKLRGKYEFYLEALKPNGEIEKFGPFTQVVSSIPRFNTQQLIGDTIMHSSKWDWDKINPELWGASMAYVAVPDKSHWPDQAFNVHSRQDSLNSTDGGDAYLSFSRRNDTERAPDTFRVLTISTHTPLTTWKNTKRNTQDYTNLKNKIGQKLLTHLARFCDEDEKNFKPAYHEFGTPLSFERYTHRLEGHVGGIPMTQEHTLIAPAHQRTFIKGLYQIGDTSFPGQSVYACTIGALSCVDKIEADL